MKSNKYLRTDIQIIRALAVISVIFYHLDKVKFSNGYLGVDVFFIVSGFLISKQIIEELNNNKFSFSRFYFKRFKRIIPALISSSIFTLVLGFYNLTLDQLYELVRGLKYALFFISNIYFSQSFNYFLTESDRNLIINLWSLSIEEQFYFIFPIFFFIIYKFRKKYIHFFIISAILLSLLFYFEHVYFYLKLDKIFFNFENFIFYSPFTRAWQLLIGCFYSILYLKIPKVNFKITNYLLFIIFLILFSNFKFYNLIFLNLFLFIVFFGEKDVNKNHLTRFLQHIGNISYSLYLFHQPIIASYRNHNYFLLKQVEEYFIFKNIALLVFCIYFVSVLNFIIIEESFRNIKTLKNIKWFPLWIFTFLLLVFLFFPKNILNFYHPLPELKSDYLKEFSIKPGTNYLLDSQNRYCTNKDNLLNACKFGNQNKNIYVIGDSTISSFVSALLTENTLRKFQVIEYTKTGTDCFPILNICEFKESNTYYEDLINIKNSIIIMGGSQNLENINMIDFKNTIDLFSSNNNKIIFIGYLPKPGLNEEMYFKKSGKFFNSFNKSYFENVTLINEKYRKTIYENFKDNIEKGELFYLDIFLVFCKGGSCNFFEDGQYLFIDYAHLSYYGARKIYFDTNIDLILDLLN